MAAPARRGHFRMRALRVVAAVQMLRAGAVILPGGASQPASRPYELWSFGDKNILNMFAEILCETLVMPALAQLTPPGG